MDRSKLLLRIADSIVDIVNENKSLVRDTEYFRIHSIRPHGRLGTGLSCPRVEFEHTSESNFEEGDSSCTYWLVIPLRELDIRSNDGKYTEWYVPFGRTSRTGSKGIPRHFQKGEQVIDTPFRDGAHSYSDMDALGLLESMPVYATIKSNEEDYVYKLPPRTKS